MKRILSAFLALVMILSMLPLDAMAASAAEAKDSTVADFWDGQAATSFSSGTGTQADPYVIETAEQLAYLAVVVNNGSFGSSYVVLANNISLDLYNWVPIGTSSNYFKGNFDGKGYCVTGMLIQSCSGAAGLFGFSSGTIRNLNVTGATVSFTDGSGKIYAGIAAAYSTGYIYDVEAQGTVKVNNSSNTAGTVYCGGITGYNGREIARCVYNGTITVTSQGGYYAGGIVGSNGAGTVAACKAEGSLITSKTGTSSSYIFCIAGGIAGGNASVVNNCYSSITVDNTVEYLNSQAISGGVVGEATSSSAEISNCYTKSYVYARSDNDCMANAGGILGYGRGTINNCYSEAGVLYAMTGDHCASNLGYIYGANSCTVNNTYYYTDSTTVIYRTEAFTDTKTEGSGCNAKTVEFTNYRSATSVSNTTATGKYEYSASLVTNTLKWGIYSSYANYCSDTNKTWIAESGAPRLFVDKIYSVTVNYHKEDKVDHVICQWFDSSASYSIASPEMVGHKVDKTVISGTVLLDCYFDVHYTKNYYNLTIEYTTTDGILLSSESKSVGYGDSYEYAVPAKTGYTAVESTVKGTMGAEPATVTAYYEPNEYTVSVEYVYAATQAAAAPSVQQKVKFNGAYSIASPEITGYTPSKDTISGVLQTAGDQKFTVTYDTNTYTIFIDYQYEDGTAIETDEHHIAYGQSYSFDAEYREGYTPDIATVSGTVTGDIRHTVTYIPNTYTLTVSYKDSTSGEAVAPDYVQQVDYGQSYSVTSPDITGFEASETVLSGTMPAGDLSKTVFYGKNMYPLVITYQYGDGTLINTNRVNVEFDSTYTVTSPQIQWYTPDLEYVTGVMPARQVDVTVVYTKNILDSGSCGENASWVLYEDGQMVISGQGQMEDYQPGQTPWQELRDSIKQVSIEEGITSVGDYAFADSVNLTAFTLPESMTRIGAMAFFSSGLKQVVISENVAKIGDGAFSGCRLLSSVTVDARNTAFVIKDYVLFTADMKTLIVFPSGKYVSGYAIPEGVETIAAYAFYNSANPRAITLPTSVTRIGQCAFEQYRYITEVQLSADEVTVEEHAFQNSGLQTLIVDGRLTAVGDGAFATSSIKSAYFKSDAPAQAGSEIFGSDSATMERLCLYYPIGNESWTEAITVAVDANGIKNEYWQGYHAYAYSGVTDVTFEMAGSLKYYATFVYCDKTPMEGVAITFGSETKNTDKDGFAYFVYPDAAQVDLKIHMDRYISSYEVASAYNIKSIGVDYFALSTDCTLNGITCYGNDITSDIGYINVQYSGSIPIVVKGNTAFEIQKMELVQMVPDAQDASKPLIPKILQTVSKGDSNLTDDGYCRFLVAAGAFAYSPVEEYPIYARMYTDSGEKAVEEQLRIKTNSFKFTGDFSKLLGEVSLELSDTGLPFLDGFELKLETPMECPLSIKAVNNEIYVTWDMGDYLDEALGDVKTQMEGKESNLKKDIEDTESRGKNYMTNLAKEANRVLNQDDLFAYYNTADFAIDTSMAGGFCFSLGEKNELQSMRSYLKLALEMKASWTADMVIIIVPVTLQVEATATGEVEISGMGFDFQKCKVLMPEVTLSAEIALKVSLGLGCRVLSAGVFGKLSLRATIVLGETSYFNALILSGEFGIYAKLDVGLFSLEGSKAWQFLDVELISQSTAEKLQTAKRSDGYMGQYNGIPVYDLSSYRLNNKHIDIDDVQWADDQAEDIQLDSYQYAKPQLIEYNDTTMAMYIDLCQGRSDYNAQALTYIQYNDELGEWTDPIIVNDDGTGDSSFELAQYNGKLYVVYTQASKVFAQEDVAGKTDQQLMMEISQSQEVVVGVYNAQENKFESFKTLSDNTFFDTNPVIRQVGDKLYVAWSTNEGAGEDMVFGMNDANQVYICAFDGETWTEPQLILADCNPISEMELVELDDKAQVAMVVDEDANYYTADDSNIYIADEEGNVTFVDCYGNTVGNLQSCVHQEQHMLVWYCGGGLKKLTSVTAAPEVLLEQETGITQDYKLTRLADDILALSWSVKNVKDAGASLEKTVVYNKLIDSTNSWTATTVAFQAPHYMMNYDMIAHNGDIRFIYTNTNIVIDDEKNDFATSSKLCSIFRTTGYALVIGEISNAKVDTEAGTVSMDAELTNDGVKTIEKVSVVLKQYSSTVAGRIEQYYAIGVYDVDIDTDVTKNVHFESEIIEGVDLEYATILIEPYEGTADQLQSQVDALNEELETVNSYGITTEDTNSALGGNIFVQEVVGGNAQTFSTQTPGLNLEGEYLVMGGTEYLSVKVTNTGTLAGSGMLNVAKLSRDGVTVEEAVYTANITELASKGIKYYLVELEEDLFDGSVAEFKCWISHYDAEDISGNKELTIKAERMDGGAAYDTGAVASELSSYNEVFDKNSTADMQLSVTLNGNAFVGVRNADFAENSTFTANADETVLQMTTSNEYLQTLEAGDYQQQFLFLTENGYIDCMLYLTVLDTTPIDLTGNIAIVGVPERGERLAVDTSGLNTQELSYSWKVDGQEVSTEIDYIIESDDLGKDLSVTVSGAGLYQGSATDSIYINKVNRAVKTPAVTVLDTAYSVKLKTGFIVGDGTVEYGWATTNDPARVTNWTTENTFTFTKDDLYYLFARVTGSEIYRDAVSEAVRYSPEPVALEITTVTLRPGRAAMYFKGDFYIDECVTVKRKGIVLSLYNEQPVADGSDPTSLCAEGTSSVTVVNIINEQKSLKKNNAHAEMQIYARAYVELEDGSYVYSKAVHMSLRDVIEIVDARWTMLSDGQKEAMKGLYTRFKEIIDQWQIENVCA